MRGFFLAVLLLSFSLLSLTAEISKDKGETADLSETSHFPQNFYFKILIMIREAEQETTTKYL